MACFCDKCADKIGMRPDTKPLLCEGCGKYFYKLNVFQKVKLFILSINKNNKVDYKKSQYDDVLAHFRKSQSSYKNKK